MIKVILVILVAAIRVSTSASISLTTPNYEWQWKCQIILTTIGVILNTLSMWLLLSLDNARKVSFYSLNVSLNIIDFLFVLNRLINSSMSYARGYSLGYGTVVCYMDTLLDMTFVTWSALVIVGISWVARNDLLSHHKVTETQMITWTACVGLYALALSFLAIYVPIKGRTWTLESSNTYCFLNLMEILPTNLYLQLGVFGPLLYLMYNVLVINNAVSKSRTILKLHGFVHNRAKEHYVGMVKKLGYFIVAMMTCYCPTLISAIYEQSTRQLFPPVLSGLAGLCAIVNSALINPLLFIYLNAHLREKLFEAVRPYKVALQSIGSLVSNASVAPIQSSAVRVTSYKDSADFNNFEIWLNDPNLFKLFKEYGNINFCSENFAFYEDAKRYQQLAQSLTSIINRYPIELPINDMKKLWSQAENLANRLYSVYIKAPTAPLEINIPSETRKEIISVLKPTTSPGGLHFFGASSTVGTVEIHFPDLSDLSREGVMKMVLIYSRVFDQAINIVVKIIRTDIWPRFSKSSMFENGRKQFSEDL